MDGDVVVIPSDYFNDQVIGFISCPNARVSSTSSTVASTNDNEVLVPYAYEVETSLVSNAKVGRTDYVGFGGWHDVFFGWQTNTSKKSNTDLE